MIEFKGHVKANLTLWLDNSTQKKELLISDNLIKIPVVEEGWKTIYIMNNDENLTISIDRTTIKKDYLEWQYVLPTYLIILISIMTIVLIFFFYITNSYKKKHIILNFPKSRRKNKKVFLKTEEVLRIISNIKKKRFYTSFFSVNDLKYEIEDFLIKKGIRDSVSFFSVYITIRKLMAKKILAEFMDMYYLYNNIENSNSIHVEEEYVKKVLIDKLINKRIVFSLVNLRNDHNYTNNSFDVNTVENANALRFDDHYMIWNEQNIELLKFIKDKKFVLLCYDKKKAFELTKKYYPLTKDQSRLTIIPVDNI
ncbi:MAG: hypothetical protein N3E37_03515 [Candidatus Micrarchaeota archaeon]|nr:hypothetical protein [Candidatus Micrarchaeota archaeon]